MHGQVDGKGEEGPGQHHALHRDIHHPAAFGDNASQGRQQQQRCVLERGMPEVGVPHQAKNIPEEAHALLLPSLVSSLSASWATAAATASAARVSGARPRDGRRSLTPRRKFAAIENRISACSTYTRLPDTPAS